MNEKFIPYIPPEKILPEFTLKVLIIGIMLSILMCAVNAYLGLYAGMTVSASIPAAVMALAIFRIVRGNILEANVVKTMAAAGEALAAGAIFTIPGLLIIYQLTKGEAGWEKFDWNQYIHMVSPLLIGGILGVFFTIPLRRILIVDLNLKYPEGVACTEVMKTMERGKGIGYVLGALCIAGIYKLASSWFGFRLWRERLIGILGSDRYRIFCGLDLSPALLGVGYIIGFRIAFYVFMGGIIGWLIFIPIVGAIFGYGGGGAKTPVEEIFWIWRSQTMYIGIGAIIVGGLHTLWRMREAIIKSVKEKFRGKLAKVLPIRTEKDLPVHYIFYIIIAVGVFIFYFWITNNFAVSGIALVFALIAAFFFTAVAGYIAGVVGSSNNPISGVTVATLLFTAIVLFKISDINAGMTATILVAAVVCASAAIAGDCMQELKTGQLLGSTPYWLQVGEVVGVIAAVFVIPPVLIYLDQVYHIGSTYLPAPQATVMASVVTGIFTGKMNWLMFFIGVFIAFILIWKKISVMAVAIGIYLPLTLSVAIMLGGILKFFCDKFAEMKENLFGGEKLAEENGILLSSGLIAGEAIMGVVIAGLAIAGVSLGAILIPSDWPGLLIFLYIAFLIVYIVLRDVLKDMSIRQIVVVLRAVIEDCRKKIF